MWVSTIDKKINMVHAIHCPLVLVLKYKYLNPYLKFGVLG